MTPPLAQSRPESTRAEEMNSNGAFTVAMSDGSSIQGVALKLIPRVTVALHKRYISRCRSERRRVVGTRVRGYIPVVLTLGST